MTVSVAQSPRVGRRSAKPRGLARLHRKVPAVIAYPVLVLAAFAALISLGDQLTRLGL